MPSLHFYYSAMDAGKSTRLLQAIHSYESRGLRARCITAQIDDRYGEGHITSRLGVSRIADGVFNKGSGLYQDLYLMSDRPHCLFVDEAQFLTKELVLQLVEIVDVLHIPVVCYGLRTDFIGDPFEGATYLLAWADRIYEIKTIDTDGTLATMNMRITETGERVWSGESTEVGLHYKPTSRSNFNLRKAQEEK